MRIRSSFINIPTAKINGTNPLPSYRKRKPIFPRVADDFPDDLKREIGYQPKVLPYLVQDRYTSERIPTDVKCFVLENEYIRATFLPEYGGRLHELYDKTLKKQLLFTNSVIQPRNLANRNAWLSGGIEWNIGNFGHTYTTCDNVFCAVLDDKCGNDFLRIYEFERNKSIFWQVDFHLPEGSRELISHVKMVNPRSVATTTYWWTNIAVPLDENTRVLSSEENVISFVDGKCKYEKLPYIDALPDIDVTYPERAGKAFDYFIQNEKNGNSTWEASVNSDGSVFFERSTAPLYYKKLFAWGNHRGGKRWQEFLSDGEGTGYYAELQAGIAPTQLHDKLLPANGAYEWTQCFGGGAYDSERLYDENYKAAISYLDSMINSRISLATMGVLDSFCKTLANIKVEPENIKHYGSGFGAVEIVRMNQFDDGRAPEALLFPLDSVTEAERPWEMLVKTGKLPEFPVGKYPLSYVTAEPWIKLLRASVDEAPDYNSLMHLGVATLEFQRTDILLKDAYDEAEDGRAISRAKQLFTRSVELSPNAVSYYSLAAIATIEGEDEKAEEYYELAMKTPEYLSDYALASEYLMLLKTHGKYEKLWQTFCELPDSFKQIDRIKITAAFAAVKLGGEEKLDYLRNFFLEEHYDIREGEVSLTKVWFEFCARKMALEDGISSPDADQLSAYMEKAEELCPPAYEIDFRMSLGKSKYR